jgi:hypothetical protein
MTTFMQEAPHIPPLQAGLVFILLARFTLVLIEGRTAQFAAGALFALSIVACAAFLTRCGERPPRDKLTSIAKILFWRMTVHGPFILHCSNYLCWVSLAERSPSRRCRCPSRRTSNSCVIFRS